VTGPAIAGLGAVATRFDAILFDQYGVLHDGRRAFAGAQDAVAQARATGLRTAVVSNSGKRAAVNAARLERLGFAPALFDAVVTSGEACRAQLAEDVVAGRLSQGAGVFVIASADDGGVLDGLPLSAATEAREAALVLIAGRDPDRFTLEQDMARLAPLAAGRVPAYCANPDATMYAGAGPAPGPGALADAYGAAGGVVTRFGKPDAPIFRAALKALDDPDPARVLMIGDSPNHDIAGARAMGMATLLVQGGVQAAAGATVEPDFTLERLIW
jgi:HAD superfamily hydrolase (TIGR01459 family)